MILALPVVINIPTLVLLLMLMGVAMTIRLKYVSHELFTVFIILLQSYCADVDLYDGCYIFNPYRNGYCNLPGGKHRTM